MIMQVLKEISRLQVAEVANAIRAELDPTLSLRTTVMKLKNIPKVT
jgi:hypothetical protein